MIARLVEANYQANRNQPTAEQIRFWLREMRTPELLIEIAQVHSDAALEAIATRPLVRSAVSGDVSAVEDALTVSVREHGKGNLGAEPRDEVIADILQKITSRQS